MVLSNMGDNDPGPWEQFAPALADRGYLVLTYRFRYPIRTRSFTTAMAEGTGSSSWPARTPRNCATY